MTREVALSVTLVRSEVITAGLTSTSSAFRGIRTFSCGVAGSPRVEPYRTPRDPYMQLLHHGQFFTLRLTASRGSRTCNCYTMMMLTMLKSCNEAIDTPLVRRYFELARSKPYFLIRSYIAAPLAIQLMLLKQDYLLLQ